MRIKNIIGFALVILGPLFSFLSQTICSDLCKTCSFKELSPCFFLFNFVAIIFIVSGTSVIITKYD